MAVEAADIDVAVKTLDDPVSIELTCDWMVELSIELKTELLCTESIEADNLKLVVISELPEETLESVFDLASEINTKLLVSKSMHAA